MAESAQTSASPAPQPSLEDKLSNLFGGSQPAIEGDEFSAETLTTDNIGDAEADESADESAAQAVSEALEDVEFDGKTWKVPKALKPGLMHTADYTRKTQDLADERRAVEATKAMVEAEGAWNKQAIKGIAALEAMDSQIEQYRKLDWSAMDTDQITRTKLAVDQLKERRGELAQALQNAHQQFQGKLQEDRAKMLKASEDYLARNVPQWSKETAKVLSDYAIEQGFTDAEMNAFDNPKLIKMAWKAQQYDALKAKQSASVKRAEGAPPVLKPGAANSLKVAQAERMNFKKALSTAKDSQSKADIIRQRLEKMYS